ncbi:GTP-binding protein [Clostridia bacterium]|nr:GTP-binding protein [Clostridia bacterium]
MANNIVNSLRKHVVLIGKTNSGKSTLFNALTGQDNAIVSETAGTTTDPVGKAMELLPFGPIFLVDTAGLGDTSDLGEERMKKTHIACRRGDAFLYVANSNDFDEDDYLAFAGKKRPHLLIFTEINTATDSAAIAAKPLTTDSPTTAQDSPTTMQDSQATTRERLFVAYPHALTFAENGDPIEIRSALSALLSELEPDDGYMIGDLIPYNSNVIFVIPVDSEAPKGRIILPQVQLLRECLDHGIRSYVVRDSELEDAIATLGEASIRLVVTDSQAFAYVNQIVPDSVQLTSFSILLARQKGNITQLLEGVDAFAHLPDGAKILMLEGCTHNHTHEDIGRVKIPKLLKEQTGKTFDFQFFSGYDFPSDLSPYAAAIQCGNCMINRREAFARLEELTAANIPVTNYGLMLAWVNGILERATELFR